MPGALSYNRRSTGGGDDPRETGQEQPGTGTGTGRHTHCRYYAADRSRHRYSSFSIMKWFRRGKQQQLECDEDAAWFRDNLKRIRQAYMASQESDYAAVTPIVPRRRPAATWSKWSGSTTTVYSFAYVNGTTAGRNHRDGDEDDDDAVEYVDAATLRAPRRRRTGHERPQSATMSSTMASTVRRRNKGIAPPPPPVAAVSAAETTSARRLARTTTTTSRKKYRAPQPPPPPPPQQQQQPPPQQRPQQRRRKKKTGAQAAGRTATTRSGELERPPTDNAVRTGPAAGTGGQD